MSKSFGKITVFLDNMLHKEASRKHNLLIFCGINLTTFFVEFVLMRLSHTTNVFALSVLPIIANAWLFGRMYAFYASMSMYACTGITYITLVDQNKRLFSDMLPGVFICALGIGVGIMVRSMRELSMRVFKLNKELQVMNKELHEAALKDPMTNLHNRRYVKEFITEYANTFLKQQSTPEFALRDQQITDKVILVMLVDIDHFKKINDTYGHDVGDKVIIEVSNRLCNAVRFDDKVTRWGGEEFLIICPKIRIVDTELVINKVLNSIRSTPIQVDESTHINVTASLGAIWLPVIKAAPASIGFEACVKLADRALYAVKASGRNHGIVVVASPMNDDSCDCAAYDAIDDFYNDPKCCSISAVGLSN